MPNCPNCGSRKEPKVVVRGGIRYYNCRSCDFSTWNRNDYVVFVQEAKRARRAAGEDSWSRLLRLNAEGRCGCGQKCKYVRLPDGTYQDIPDVCACHDEE